MISARGFPSDGNQVPFSSPVVISLSKNQLSLPLPISIDKSEMEPSITTTPPSITIVDHELPYDSHNTYDVTFFGDSVFTTVTSDPTIASQWISEIDRDGQHLIVGLDVEWRPSFNRHVAYPAATLQLCVCLRCLIFQLIHSPSVPPPLVDFLANPNHTFVGIGIEADLEKLEEDYEFGFNTNAVDLRGLAALVLEKEVDKPKNVTMSRWDNQWLTPTQVRYACVSACV
ncbi:hypothetical protein SASPL_115060 [Salvia splendens]|uniref:3'-5' exonuclease domain-containing protein n=1 Tax=Salvia splendens TaxID=180675 RepID=A0A8X8Y5V9_SALSN|nr:hypothetical protein SASPL_115060 [Salvia splendens]